MMAALPSVVTWSALLLLAAVPDVNGQTDPVLKGCYRDLTPDAARFTYSGGLIDLVTGTPKECSLSCLKQGLEPITGYTMGVGITQGHLCLCGYLPAVIDMVAQIGVGCDQPCPGDASLLCGGSYGHISVYEVFNYATRALTLTLKDSSGPLASGVSVPTREELYLEVIQGDYTCTAFPGQENINCEETNTNTMPPLEITVDYGDGSGPSTWTRDLPLNIWKHKYTRPGDYVIFYRAENVNDMFTMTETLTVKVEEPISDYDWMEIVCPPVIDPGTYFNCHIDIPRGSHLTATVTMIDLHCDAIEGDENCNGDLDGIQTLPDSTGTISIPEYWYNVPGGVLTDASYDSADSTTTHSLDLGVNDASLILSTTRFHSVVNISEFEMVPQSTGTLLVEVVVPVCEDGFVWCPMISKCHDGCTAHFGFSTDERECTTYLCSQQQTCENEIACPLSGNEGDSPLSYKPVKTFEFEVDSGDVGSKLYFDVMKEIWTNSNPPAEPDAFLGYKTHSEDEFEGGYLLAIRCIDGLPCPKLSVRQIDTSLINADLAVLWDDTEGLYMVNTVDPPLTTQVMLRPTLVEDRWLDLEKKFFCERATDKKITLVVTDAFDTIVEKTTSQVSCQYPIVEITDLTASLGKNKATNAWSVINEFPTVEEVEQDEAAKEYYAEAWVSKNEPFVLDVMFGKGSHVKVDWHVTEPIASVEADDKCTPAFHPVSIPIIPDVTDVVFVDTDDANIDCIFPFWYKNVLYYGCTELTINTFVYKICATEIDTKTFRAKKISWCNDNCHVQHPRPTEIEGSTEEQAHQIFQETEGTQNVFSKKYILPKETQLMLTRYFSTPGTEYIVTLTAENMHDETDTAIMVWKVICGYPIVADDWTMTYPPFLENGNDFTVTFTINPNVPLPTRPILRIADIEGMQRTDHDIEVQNATDIVFYVATQSALNDPPDCLDGNSDDERCIIMLELENVGMNANVDSGAQGTISPDLGTSLKIIIPAFSDPGSHGFSVQFVNGISNIKDHYVLWTPNTEHIQLLDPGPQGSGEWVTISSLKWELNWVETFETVPTNLEATFQYTMSKFPDQIFDCDYVTNKWYLPASAQPYFSVSIMAGNVRRIQYTFNNTEVGVGEYQPPPCFVDWPQNTFSGQLTWSIGHCPNLTEGTYLVVMSVWNPINDWISTKPTKFEVLEGIGPITISDHLITTDKEEPKDFRIQLERAGLKTCVVAVWGDDDEHRDYWGNAASCKLRYPDLEASDVLYLDTILKTIDTTHTYANRGNFIVHVFGFDERHYAEARLPVAVLGISCPAPDVWIPENHTSWENLEVVPKILKSKTFAVQAYGSVNCDEAESWALWEAFEVTLKDDPASQTGKTEMLTPINIADTMPSYTTSLLQVPKLAFNYGLHKLVYRVEIDTGDPEVRLYREAFTYLMIDKSPLQPVLMEGSVAKISRGWSQSLSLTPETLSKDPDFPTETNFNYTWFCRVVSPTLEEYPNVDEEGYPEFDESIAQIIPRPSAAQINPQPGCFGVGPKPLKTRSGTLTMQTDSFITYSQIYEILLVLEKDTRRAKVKIEVEMFSVPAPILKIQCASTCYPTFGGVFVNPSSRLALRGQCTAECQGDEEYKWSIIRAPDDPYKAKPITDVYCEPGAVVVTTEVHTTTTTSTTTTTTTTTPKELYEINCLSLIGETDGLLCCSVEKNSARPTSISVIVQTSISQSRRRREVDMSLISTGNGQLIPGCLWIYGDGLSEKRFSKELSIRQPFFDIQEDTFEKFVLQLNVSNEVDNGRKITEVYGTSYLNVFINSPPENGTCNINMKTQDETGKDVWTPAKTGRALLDQFTIQCQDWEDPDDHAITKYVFKITEQTDKGPKTSILYSGPTRDATVIFPVGKFELFAEIHEEAQAFRTFPIDTEFPIYLPDERDYENYDKKAALEGTTNMATIAQILKADASIRKSACMFDFECAMLQEDPELVDLDVDQMTPSQREKLNEMIRRITQINTDDINAAKDNLQFSTIDQLAQGTNTLAAITGNIVDNGPLSKTLDMEGRESAVELMSLMAEGFKGIESTDPTQLDNIITGLTGSVMAITSSLNDILYDNDPEAIPLGDFEKAKTMDYDTDITDVDSFIPDDPEDAYRHNAFKLTRFNAVKQVKKMIEIVDDVAETTIINMVEGEEMRSKTPLGVQMIMSKLGGENTVGRDTDGDGIPDMKLRFEFENSESVVQFPLGFCPSSRETGMIRLKSPCKGRWGFVVKEWETITASYPHSARNLNRVTKQVDIDLYNDLGGKVDVSGMAVNIDITIERMKAKDPEAVSFSAATTTNVDCRLRLKRLQQRKKKNLIYHYVNVTRPYATVNVQIKTVHIDSSRFLIFARHQKMPTTTKCDFVKVISKVTLRDGTFIDWFIPKETINNRTNQWYFGVAVVQRTFDLETITDMASCSENPNIDHTAFAGPDDLPSNQEGKEHVDGDQDASYSLRIYSGGCYYFNAESEVWENLDMTVYNTTQLTTSCGVKHLTSFGSGFFPEPNTIDFEYVFAAMSFQDNITIYLMLIISFVFYIIAMIWAFINDRKDIKSLPVPVLLDNHPEDTYFYEMLVETGPMANHGTTSNIYFILHGDDDHTGERCFTNPERDIFDVGTTDAFLLATQHPLGELSYIRVWNDNSGLGDSGSWYLMSITITDVQNGTRVRFVADQWIACDRGTFEDDIVVHATGDGDDEQAGYVMKSQGNRKLADDHVWWSPFSRPQRSRFSRKARVTVCMAMLYLFFVTNAMYYETQVEVVGKPYFTIGPLKFDKIFVAVGMATNLIVFPPILLAIFLFKKSRPLGGKRRNRIDLGLEEAKERGWFVPPSLCPSGNSREQTPAEKQRDTSWSSIGNLLAWLICLICIGAGAFFVFAYALQFGNDKTYQWIVSMISAFFSSVIITQPLKIMFITLLIGCCCRQTRWDDDHTEMDEEIPHIYYDEATEAAKSYRPKADKREFENKFYHHLVKIRNQELEMRVVIKDIVVYFVYVIIIFIISYGNRDPNAYMAKEAMEKAIIFGGVNCEVFPSDDLRYRPCTEEQLPIRYVNFNKIRDINEWYGWMNMTLIPNVRVQPWYNGKQPYGLKGYLDDRVNRLIGYAIVRQIREKPKTCRTASVIREQIDACTGNGGVTTEDENDYCLGWKPKEHEDCVEAEEFEYLSSIDLESTTMVAGIRNYGGGGYVLKLTGYILDLQERIQLLQRENWVNNRTRALMVEFSSYNAQVNLFSLVTCVAEFVGGGIRPYYTIEVFRLFNNVSGFGTLVAIAEILFVASIFYYIVSLLTILKKEGCRDFCRDSVVLMDILTVVLSIMALGLWVAKTLVTIDLKTEVQESSGNRYIRLTYAALLNKFYEYLVSITVFTSTIKFSRLLSFQRAFMQITATMKLCFKGLSTFLVEFFLVFGGFSAFFFFVLKNDLENFRDFLRTTENTLAMSIGKFNFAALRTADEMAAWIFFVFSLVVNMILINMMMAIINLAFEEIKSNADAYESKFQLVEYIKRTARQVIGIEIAKPVEVIYSEKQEESSSDEEEMDATEKTSNEFAEKTGKLLQYVHHMYLGNNPMGAEFMKKLRQGAGVSEDDEGGEAERTVKQFGFDRFFEPEDGESDPQG